MLNKIKLLLGISDASKDLLITLLIEKAITEAMTYTNNSDIPDNLVMDIVVWRYNRLGTEGVDSEDYSGVSFEYSADYPENILRLMKAIRRVRVI